jgi:hypothetical protein
MVQESIGLPLKAGFSYATGFTSVEAFRGGLSLGI